jgi:very-short-patch-repair endonuclease
MGTTASSLPRWLTTVIRPNAPVPREIASSPVGLQASAKTPTSSLAPATVETWSRLPTLPLSWHYRSRHEALITYSNYRFYEGRLRTFPSAIQAGDGVGVTFVNAHGTYRRGGARDNPIEAAKVVERVLFHRQAHPDLTIGVVAFSSAHASAIEAEIEHQAQRHPELNKLRLDDRLDGFFVKNLENVQGDERDIILFSIGYGPDENGRFTEQLGPLGLQGGERRLNVAITRARSRVEVISSVTAAEFPGTSPAPGIRHLQNYLAFAEHGMSALALDVDTSSGDIESPFEEEVLRVVREMGYDATPQVGVAGFRIDLGVKHPGRPGEFVLGIECDGAAYHSSKVARDRDRLRQEILERLGWRIHRIWGPSWYRNRDAQSEQLRKAIEDAIAGRRSSRTVRREPRSGTPEIEIRDAVLDQRPAWAHAYVAAVPKTPITMNEADFTSAQAHRAIVAAIGEIVDAEGPIHLDVVRLRVQEWFGIARMSAARRASFDKALASYRRSSACTSDGAYLFSGSLSSMVVRVPGDQHATRRTVAEIASSERQLAIELLVKDARRISRDELMTGFARLFGWQRAGADIRSSFERDLGLLLKAGALNEKDGIVEVKGQAVKGPSAGKKVRSAGPPSRATN